MRLHFQEQISSYGEQKLVSLVNHKGYEQPVKEAYEKYVAQVRLSTYHSYCLVVYKWFVGQPT